MKTLTTFADRLINRLVPTNRASADTCYPVPCGPTNECFQQACRDENGNLYFKKCSC